MRNRGGKHNRIRNAIYSLVVTLALLLTSCGSGANKSDEFEGPGGANALIAGCNPGNYKQLPSPPMELDAQYGNQWCWAASAQMVMTYLGKTITQCSQVNDWNRRQDCCPDSSTSPCTDLTGWPQFCRHQVNNDLRHGGLTLAELKEQISCKGSPIAFSWHWTATPTQGHMMVAVGYLSDESGDYVLVNDPDKSGGQRIAFDSYFADKPQSDDIYAEHHHWDDFYNFRNDQAANCTAANSESQP